MSDYWTWEKMPEKPTYVVGVDPYKQPISMKGTDTFHLGDDYYVYVTVDVEKCLIVGEFGGGKHGKIVYAFIGSNWYDPLQVNGIIFLATAEAYEKPIDENALMSQAKSELAEIILQHRELLIEIIREREYLNHIDNYENKF